MCEINKFTLDELLYSLEKGEKKYMKVCCKMGTANDRDYDVLDYTRTELFSNNMLLEKKIAEKRKEALAKKSFVDDMPFFDPFKKRPKVVIENKNKIEIVKVEIKQANVCFQEEKTYFIEKIENRYLAQVAHNIEVEEDDYVLNKVNDVQCAPAGPIDEDYFNWFCAKLEYDIEDYIPPARKLSEIFGNANTSQLILVGGMPPGRGYNKAKRGQVKKRVFERGNNKNGRRLVPTVRKGFRAKRDLGPRYVNARNNRPVMTIGRELNPFPDIFFVTLDYFENNYRMDLGTTDKLLNIGLSINDPYDPYAAIGGKSAMYFAQIGAMYRYCRVNMTKIIVTYTDNPAANTCPIQTALVYNSEGVSYADMDDIISLPSSKRVVHLGLTNRIGGTKTIYGTFYPRNSFLMTRLMWDSQAAGSTYDVTNIGGFVSPITLSLVDLYYGRIDESDSTAISCRASIKMSYHVKFYDRQSFTE